MEVFWKEIICKLINSLMMEWGENCFIAVNVDNGPFVSCHMGLLVWKWTIICFYCPAEGSLMDAQVGLISPYVWQKPCAFQKHNRITLISFNMCMLWIRHLPTCDILHKLYRSVTITSFWQIALNSVAKGLWKTMPNQSKQKKAFYQRWCTSTHYLKKIQPFTW